jgi:hypothetical protein
MVRPRNDVRQAVLCAQDAAALIPPPPGSAIGARYPELCEAWFTLVLDAAAIVAAAANDDEDVLRRAIGPELEVGGNPLWRIFLQLALATVSIVPRKPTGAPGAVLRAAGGEHRDAGAVASSADICPLLQDSGLPARRVAGSRRSAR